MKETIKKWYEAFGGLRSTIRLISLVSLFTFLFFLDFIGAWSEVGKCNLNGWLGAFLSSFAYASTFVALSLIMPRKVAKIFYPLSAGWILFFSTISIVAQQNFGMVFRGETLLILIGSSWSEIKEFFAMYAKPTWVLGVIVFAIVDFMAVFALIKCKYFKVSKAAYIIGIAMFIPWIVWTCKFPPRRNSLTPTMASMIKSCTVLSRISSFSVFESTYKSYQQVNNLVKAAIHPQIGDNLVRKYDNDNVLGVLVLGESVTRNHCSLYGYGLNTTSKIDARREKLFVFDNLVTPAPGTTAALRYILSAATVERYEDARYLFPSICKGVGYKCSFLSNQDHWGAFDGVDDVLFKACETKHWIGDEIKVDAKERYDEKLLPLFADELSCGNSTALFIHMQGSHSDAKDKYPPSMAKFGLDENGILKDDATKSEHYDNSIAYTDYVLDEMLKMLEKRGGASFLVYLSDHGESPSSEYWRYAPDKDLWEVPMFIWMSEEYKAKYPEIVEQVKKSVNKPLVSDQLLFGFTKLFLVEGLPDYKEEEDFLSDKFVPREKRYNEKVQGVK